MLNYAYAVLIAQTQIRLIVEGYDPTIGIMHDKKALRGINPGFALDHMEPMRPVVDRAVLHLIDTVTFTGALFNSERRCLPNECGACTEGGAACIGAM
jgi:CRISPR-associated protein Cas1